MCMFFNCSPCSSKVLHAENNETRNNINTESSLPKDDWGNGNQASCLKCVLDLLEIPPAALGHKIDPGHKVDPEFIAGFARKW